MLVRAAALLAMMGLGSTAFAQSRLAINSSLGVQQPDMTWVFGLPSQRLEWSGPGRRLNGVFSGTGRYYVWVEELSRSPFLLQLRVGDVMTGGVWGHDLPGYNGAYITANPRTDEVYVLLARGFDGLLTAVTPGQIRPLRECSLTQPAVSRDGTVVFCHFIDRLVAVDPSSGKTISAHTIGRTAPLATDATGSTVVVAGSNMLRVFDTTTGDVVRSGSMPFSPGTEFFGSFGDWSDDGYYFLHGRKLDRVAHETILVDPMTLTARQTLPLPPSRWVLDIVVTPDGRTAFVASVEHISGFFDVIDLPTNQVTFTTTQFSAWQALFLALTSAPLTPTGLRAEVGQQSVRFDWTVAPASDGVTHFVIEGGSVPGQTDVRLQIPGSARELHVPGVLRGRYFVRLRAVNATGSSKPTRELVVDVP